VEWLATLQHTVAIAMLIGGAFIMLVGSIGINRLPDFYSRTHAAATSTPSASCSSSAASWSTRAST